MATVAIPIEYVEAHRLLVCHLCESVVSASGLDPHIGGSRHRLLKHNTAANRRALVKRLGAHAAYNLDELQRPTAPVEVIPGLRLHRNGLACRFPGSECKFIVRDTDSMMRHSKRVHGWKNEQRPGKHRDAEERKLLPWTTNVPCQRFMQKGPHSSFFEVTLACSPSRAAATLDEAPDPVPSRTLSCPLEANFDRSIDNLEYNLNLNNADATDNSCIWHGNELFLENFRLSRSTLQKFVRSLLSAARRVLTEKILFVAHLAHLPGIEWSSIVDNQADHSSGYICTNDENNYFLVNAIDWFDAKLRADKKLGDYFLKDVTKQVHKEGNIKQERVQIWLNSIAKFKENLLLLMYISGGMPVSSEEILSLRFRNDTNDLQRNIFIENVLVYFEIMHVKSLKTTRSEQIILRYLPQQVGELFFYYLSLVLPNQRRFEVLQGSHTAESSFMWPSELDVDKRRWTKKRMKIALENASVDSIGIKLNIASYHLIALAFMERYIGEDLLHESMTASQEKDDESDSESLYNVPREQPQDMQASQNCGNDFETHSALQNQRKASRALSIQWHELLGFPFTDLYQVSSSQNSLQSSISGKRITGKRQQVAHPAGNGKRSKYSHTEESSSGQEPLGIRPDAGTKDTQTVVFHADGHAAPIGDHRADVVQVADVHSTSRRSLPLGPIGRPGSERAVASRQHGSQVTTTEQSSDSDLEPVPDFSIGLKACSNPGISLQSRTADTCGAMSLQISPNTAQNCLDKLNGHCMPCIVFGHSLSQSNHPYWQCPLNSLDSKLRGLIERVDCVKHTCCFRCRLPLRMCPDKKCTYKDIVVPAITTAIKLPRFQVLCLGLEGCPVSSFNNFASDVTELVTWLNQQVTWQDDNANYMWLFFLGILAVSEICQLRPDSEQSAT